MKLFVFVDDSDVTVYAPGEVMDVTIVTEEFTGDFTVREDRTLNKSEYLVSALERHGYETESKELEELLK